MGDGAAFERARRAHGVRAGRVHRLGAQPLCAGADGTLRRGGSVGNGLQHCAAVYGSRHFCRADAGICSRGAIGQGAVRAGDSAFDDVDPAVSVADRPFAAGFTDGKRAQACGRPVRDCVVRRRRRADRGHALGQTQADRTHQPVQNGRRIFRRYRRRGAGYGGLRGRFGAAGRCSAAVAVRAAGRRRHAVCRFGRPGAFHGQAQLRHQGLQPPAAAARRRAGSL